MIASPASPKVLHIGSGHKKIRGAITLDVNPRVSPDVVWDLDLVPYPFADNTFDLVVCEHVLEHLNDVIRVMEELHRVTRPGGRIHVFVPHFSSLNFNTDLTHRHAFSSRSFDYVCEDMPLSRYEYSGVRFRKLRGRMVIRKKPTWLDHALIRLVNRYLDFYEEHLVYIIPGQELEFVLEVVK